MTMQTNIIATVFGGSSDDPQYSAYPPYDLIGDDTLGAALPMTGLRGKIITITNHANGATVTVKGVRIVDVGPHHTDDPYWETGTRPRAETDPANQDDEDHRSGIDLCTKTATALGIKWGYQWCDDAKVDWEFEDNLSNREPS